MKIEVGKAYKCRYGLIWFCEAIVAKLHTFKEHAVMYSLFGMNGETVYGSPELVEELAAWPIRESPICIIKL